MAVKQFQDWYLFAHNRDPFVVLRSVLYPYYFSYGLKRDKNCSETVIRIYQKTRRDIRKNRKLQTCQSVQTLLSCMFCKSRKTVTY
jgi:hypothetical protein